jgi:hypothetical protein
MLSYLTGHWAQECRWLPKSHGIALKAGESGKAPGVAIEKAESLENGLKSDVRPFRRPFGGPFAMQKVVGSSPIIRFYNPRKSGVFVL